MGGTTGAVLDRGLSLGGVLYDPERVGIKKGAEDMQKHYGDQITNFMNAPDDALDSASDAVSSVADSESAKNANPFSMASYGNSMRQRRKSGFGRRQTFKGLTG